MARNDPLRNFRFRLEIDGVEQAGFAEPFIEPVRHALSQLGSEDVNGSPAQRFMRRVNRMLYRLAWRYRHLVRPLVHPKIRHRWRYELSWRLAISGQAFSVSFVGWHFWSIRSVENPKSVH